MAIGPEHKLQIQVCKLIKGCIVAPVCWTSVDRRAKTSALSHIAEAARGIKAGVADLFIAQGPKWLWLELKAGNNDVSEHQLNWEIETCAAGGSYFVARSLAEVVSGLRRVGIDLHPNADVVAMRLDALLATPSAPGRKRTSKPRAERPKQSALRKVAAIRSRIPF